MTRHLAAALGVSLLAFVSPLEVTAQTSDAELKREIENLQKGQRTIENQIRELKRLLEGKPAAAARSGSGIQNKIFDLGANPIKGESAAKLTLIEFVDYQCGYCARHVRETYPQIAKAYIDTGKIRYAALDLPIEKLHKLAFEAAEVSHCAEEQGRFWEMHDRLFQQQRTLEPWDAHAEALGLDAAELRDCLESGKHASAIRQDMAVALAAGATKTPSFVLGLTDPDDPGSVKGITLLEGIQSFDRFQTEIDKLLP